MKIVFTYIKLYLLFILRVITLRVYVELVYWITTILWNCVVSIFHLTNNGLPEYVYVNLISFGVAITLALQTTYYVDGVKGKVWSGEFGFNPDNFKDEEKN